MQDKGTGDYFIRDEGEDSFDEDDLLTAPVVVPARPPSIDEVSAPQPSQPAPETPAEASPEAVQAAEPAPVAPAAEPEPVAEPVQQRPAPAAEPAPQPVAPPVAQAPTSPEPAPVQDGDSREAQLAGALNTLMAGSPDIEAAALISLDGFTMASALPEGMQEDRVGAMSAAILGLGERAAVELGRGGLSQVFIEGTDGYVLLMSTGGRAVLTALAAVDAKLGLVLYDMRTAADAIGAVFE
jgi:predicted regulator of Ras-like GTPase activity (Roadblock/LC7/MglB family)